MHYFSRSITQHSNFTQSTVVGSSICLPASTHSSGQRLPARWLKMCLLDIFQYVTTCHSVLCISEWSSFLLFRHCHLLCQFALDCRSTQFLLIIAAQNVAILEAHKKNPYIFSTSENSHSVTLKKYFCPLKKLFNQIEWTANTNHIVFYFSYYKVAHCPLSKYIIEGK